MADATILRDLGLNWLECQDGQGVFYFNQATQQSSEAFPAELEAAGAAAGAVPMVVAAPAAAAFVPPAAGVAGVAGARPPAKAKVLSGGIASLQQGAAPLGGVVAQVVPQTYQPQQLQQVVQPQFATPWQRQALQPTGVSSYTPLQQAPPQQPQVISSYTPLQQAAPQPFQAEPAPAKQKIAFGDWGVYEDELGSFYMQVSTGQQFQSPPPEFMQAYQQYRAEQDQLHLQQIQQIELQKQQIDQQLAEQTQSLRMTYGIGGAPIPA